MVAVFGNQQEKLSKFLVRKCAVYSSQLEKLFKFKNKQKAEAHLSLQNYSQKKEEKRRHAIVLKKSKHE